MDYKPSYKNIQIYDINLAENVPKDKATTKRVGLEQYRVIQTFNFIFYSQHQNVTVVSQENRQSIKVNLSNQTKHSTFNLFFFSVNFLNKRIESSKKFLSISKQQAYQQSNSQRKDQYNKSTFVQLKQRQQAYLLNNIYLRQYFSIVYQQYSYYYKEKRQLFSKLQQLNLFQPLWKLTYITAISKYRMHHINIFNKRFIQLINLCIIYLLLQMQFMQASFNKYIRITIKNQRKKYKSYMQSNFPGKIKQIYSTSYQKLIFYSEKSFFRYEK
ncbi:transmembrane protein, putative (macronuclear) [Tetrahymena thermophila SB210]|uniref:Transmembrane protein, putative n=1 Tax=Tetrahymena thermophila (strain SB210) TaxID=312017 RepID=W7X4U3_TETTS|nr:transmembrane protein, putative [Tetrahymena thermophila SB210]EWS72447.1 transmembrane protein, putative [Tetrahymena thermophila SB210]|eukprot:XP_012655018.1 transmembrane protein, putative [Tetrahymena thermophila SB210]